MEIGSKVWVTDLKEGWAMGTITEKLGQAHILVDVKGEISKKSSSEAFSSLGSEINQMRGIADLTKLPALHEAALLQALQERYVGDEIYTSVGPILLAVNPFRRIAKLYDCSHKWIQQQRDLPPHVYGLAHAAFKAMQENEGCNQSILVSGESGAGKTETTKIAMQYLTEVSGGGGGSADVSARILQANPLMEAFGNAKTVRNDNSSRFGKMIEMKFAAEGRNRLSGAGVTSYLLEKARVVHQARGERNYHIFYELFEGASSAQRSTWKLKSSPTAHRYLSSSGEYARADIKDSEQFQFTIKAMTTMGFSQADCDAVFRVVAGILHIGDIEFEERKGGEACAIKNIEAVNLAAELLGIDAGKSSDKSLTEPDLTLADVLCIRKVTVQGVAGGGGGGSGREGGSSGHRLSDPSMPSIETYVKPLSVQFAREARDALAMTLYERLFAWIVWRVNHSMEWVSHHVNHEPVEEPFTGKGLEKLRFQYRIGVLDIFGFEVFQQNFFEQLCINYANEQLQRQFNEHVFELEQKMYESEGVDWTFVQFPDNSPTILMIEAKPIGLLSLIDEECMYPNGNDKSLASKLYQNMQGKSDRFVATQLDQRDFLFTVKHFAGDVSYTVSGFYKKNKNELRQDAVDMMVGSSTFLVRLLLPPDAQEATGGADASSYFHKRAHQLGVQVLAAPGSREALDSARAPLPPMQKVQPVHHQTSPAGRMTGRRSQLQQTTVSSHFKTQLHSAMSLIRASHPHYVRCLKPNDKNKPNIFTRPRVLDQLRYSGVVEVIKVARAGYPTRFDVPVFVERYGLLMGVKNEKGKKGAKNAGLIEARKMVKRGDQKELMQAARSMCDGAGLVVNKDFQVGKTKVFLRSDATTKLELAKSNKVKGSVRIIQRTWRRWFKLHRHDRAARKIQRTLRGFLARAKWVPVLERRRAAADYIHSSPNLRRWVMQIRGGLKTTLAKDANAYDAAEDPEKGTQTNLFWWWAIPLSIMAGVPAFMKRLYYYNSNLLLLFLLAMTGLTMGSILMVDAQRRGAVPRVILKGGSAVVSKASKASSALAAKRKAGADKFRGDATPSKGGSKAPASTLKKKGATAASIPAATSQVRRFVGVGGALPPKPTVEIRVNADAVKRFAGLAARRQEAMDHAKTRAEEMLKSGELMKSKPQQANHIVVTSVKTPAKPVLTKTASPSAPTPVSVSAPKHVTPPTAAATAVAKIQAKRNSTGNGMTSPAISPTQSPRGSVVLSPGTSAVKSAAAPSKASAPPTKDRADSGLNDDEQFALNHAILSMFLEDQAPDRVDMADDLLKEFKGREETLFDKLTNHFPDVDALHFSETTDTPAWDKFRARRKQSQKGFFGTKTQEHDYDDDVHLVTEKSSTGMKKNRFSRSEKKKDKAVTVGTPGLAAATSNLYHKFTGN